MATVLQFLFVAVLTTAVSCVPLPESSSNDTQVDLNHLYCTAVGLTSNAILMLHAVPINFTVQCAKNDTAVEIVNQTFHQLSDECRNYTVVMSLKHQLQDLTSNNHGGLSVILHHLQTLASAFDDAALKKEGKNCTSLSAEKYKTIHCMRYSNSNSLLHSVMVFGGDWLERAHKNGIFIRDCYA